MVETVPIWSHMAMNYGGVRGPCLQVVARGPSAGLAGLQTPVDEFVLCRRSGLGRACAEEMSSSVAWP